jgi:hypothetical protein
MKGNVQLVAFEFNTPTFEARGSPEHINGKQSWTKEKFEFMKKSYFEYKKSIHKDDIGSSST